MKSFRTNKTARLELTRRYGHLFWYVSEEDKDKISLDALVEAILNYGDMEAVRYLLGLVGIKTVSGIFCLPESPCKPLE